MKTWEMRFLAFAAVFSVVIVSGYTAVIKTANIADEDNPWNIEKINRDIETYLQFHSPNDYLLQSNDDMDKIVGFYVFSRSNLDSMDYKIHIGNVTSLRNSPFDMTKETKILIHGFIDSAEGIMTTDLKNSILVAADVNVIAVDWSTIALDILYPRVAMKTHAVGLYVAKMLDFIVNEGYDFSKFHLIGHSLGAHVSGSAGSALIRGKIQRISAMDPALPGFGWIKLSRKLTHNDAQFVDCVHTCGGLLGIFEPFCHADFYPNKGTHPQPGCPYVDFGTCSHLRSFRFFAESMLRNHIFPALQCDKVNVNCKKSSVNMGNYLNSTVRGIFYTNTLSEYPFAPERV